MINIIMYTSDETFVENTKRLIANAFKTGKIDDDIEIQISTKDKKKILWNLENQVVSATAINLYLIDIEGKNKKEGVELAKEIRKSDALSYIVFVSDVMCDASELMNHSIKASDFFFKPIGTYEFIDLINEILYDSSQITKARANYLSGHIVVKSDYKSRLIFLSDIITIEYARPKSIIETTYGIIKVNIPLQELYNRLLEVDNLGTIVQTHQSFIVNLANTEIMDYKNLQITTKKGKRIPIARTRKSEVKETLDTTLRNNLITTIKVKK